MISKEAHHKAFNEPLYHMKKTSPYPVHPRKSRSQPELEVNMVARVSNDDIEFKKTRSQHKNTKFHEDISEFVNTLVDMNLVCHPPIKEPPHIKPLNYQVHIFCNFHRVANHSIKVCYH